MTAEPLAVVREGEVLRVVLNRPERRNALDRTAMDELTDVVVEAGRDAVVRVIVLTGHGDHFCAGADISDAGRPRAEPPDRTGDVHRVMRASAHRLLMAMWDVEVPVVAGVRGTAAGFGCMLALVADRVVAADDARFTVPYVRRGFSADSGSTWLLPRLVGVARAKDMLLGGRAVTGEQAASWGLVSDAVPVGDLDAAVDAAVASFAAAATVAVGLTRGLVHQNLDGDLRSALRAEEMAVELSVRSPDFKEGMAAFRDGRDPRYSGR